MTLKDWMLLILLSVLWGGSFFFGAIAVKEIPPLTVTLLRVSIAAVTMLMVFRFGTELTATLRKHWGSFFTMGLVNNLIPFALLFWAQTIISSGLASILNAATPIFSIVVAHFALTDEPMTPNKVGGVALGVAGVVVLVGVDVLSGLDTATLGILACLGAALSYGVASVYGRRFQALKIKPSVGAFGQLAASSIVATPVILYLDEPWTLPPPSAEVMMSVLALSVFSTALAYLIYFRLIQSAGAVNAALVTLLVPVSALVLGATFLQEQIHLTHLIGFGLISLGLIVVSGRPPYRRQATDSG